LAGEDEYLERPGIAKVVSGLEQMSMRTADRMLEFSEN
jgi:hypothetical protein